MQLEEHRSWAECWLATVCHSSPVLHQSECVSGSLGRQAKQIADPTPEILPWNYHFLQVSVDADAVGLGPTFRSMALG